MQFYLSIIATSRNDNHGGDLNERTGAFLKSVYHQAKQWNLPVELIMVEWNPPEGKPHLHEVLPPPPPETPVVVRYITVSKEIHNKYKNSHSIPLYQMIAKNVGIRRAKGEFILCTNIDIIFSSECFELISKKQLEKNTFYRANRCDVPSELMAITDQNVLLEYCQKHLLRRLGKSPGNEALHLFQLVPRFLYFFPRLAKSLNYLIIAVWKMKHKNQYPFFLIDFEACGDFTLMSKSDWMDIQGYVELDMYSIHIDSMALWAAIAVGKKQELFPYAACVYHIDHEDGWESSNALKTIKFLQNKPCLDYSIIFKAGLQIIEKKQHWDMNTSEWGMANLSLYEKEFKGKIEE